MTMYLLSVSISIEKFLLNGNKSGRYCLLSQYFYNEFYVKPSGIRFCFYVYNMGAILYLFLRCLVCFICVGDPFLHT